MVDLCDHSRPWIDWGRRAGVPVWADLHDYDGTSAFHADFLRANHLQLSSVRLPDWRGWAAGVATSGRSVVVTHGSRGSSALDGDGVWTDIAGEVLDVVDTNGAGDAFFAGFLLERSAGSDVTRSLRAGARQAAVCLGGPHLAGTVGELVG